jgi:type VI secretion system protein VasG
VENILSRTLLPELSGEVLAHLAEGRQVGGIRVGLAPDGGFAYTVEAA